MKDKAPIPSWLEGWHSEYQTCLEVWQDMKDKALSHQLSKTQVEEVENLIEKYVLLQKEIDLSGTKTPLKRFRDELFPHGDKIRDYWKTYGYNDFRIIENGKIGMRSIKGTVALNPEYDDICFTYDEKEFFYMNTFPVKRGGKWGLVNDKNEIVLPFEYDFIFRKPESLFCYVLIKNGHQGIASINNKGFANVVVPIEMDAVYNVPGWDIVLFSKDGKWGWWWDDSSSFYNNYSKPEYDQIYIQPIQEVWKMDDDEDELFVARKVDSLYHILYWTSK